jgi:uncharacterized protein (TIGR03437 family)
MKRLVNFSCALLILAGTAAAQPKISEVVNAGNRFASGLPGYGIAQGAIFVVTGNGLGPDDIQKASFPLPAADGLAGVTIRVTVGGTTVNAIMVYASAKEVAAILPSSTPTGTGDLILTKDGQDVKASVTVVSAAFGGFTQGQTGSGPAVAFNVGSDGTTTLNTLTQPAQAGQNVMLNGTGLGAITSDETQTGVTDVPSSDVKVWVGSKQATLVSAGRGNCCTGLDANFKIPQGVAGWDVIQFTVPDGVAACHVPVAVQTGNVVSNFTSIAVANSGSGCTDPGGFNGGDLGNLSGTIKVGSVTLSRNSSKISMQGINVESKSDSGGAFFFAYDLSQFQNSASPFSVAAIGSCFVSLSKSGPGVDVPIPAFTQLDAGDAINVTRAGTTKQMKKSQFGGYSADFGTSTSISGLPPGIPLPPGLGGGTPFLDAGSYTADNGGGGPDVGSFNASLTVPQPLVWENQDQLTSVTRSQGVNVRWSGGAADSLVTIIGSSSAKVGDATVSGTFICTERQPALQFTVPAIVTLSLPGTPAGSTTGGGILGVSSTVTNSFKAPNIDIGVFSSSVGSIKSLSYQ